MAAGIAVGDWADSGRRDGASDPSVGGGSCTAVASSVVSSGADGGTGGAVTVA